MTTTRNQAGSCGTTTSRGCGVGKQFIKAQTCFSGDALQHLDRRRVAIVHKVRNRRLAHANSLREISLFRVRPFEEISERFHMEAKTIGFAYDYAIGRSYSEVIHNWGMRKHPERTFLDRALEALGERFPRERPTQTRLAQMVGIKQPSVNEWGDKDRAPAIATGVKLAKQLGVCVEWLYTERGPKRPTEAPAADEELSPILAVWPDLDPATKRRISRYADFIKDEK